MVLRHEAPDGVHFDWLLDPPVKHALPEGRLWTLRVALPPEQWLQGGQFEARELAPHRRAYLEYEGEVSGGRGSVRRVAAGLYQSRAWRRERVELDVRMEEWTLRVVLARVDEGLWRVSASARAPELPGH